MAQDDFNAWVGRNTRHIAAERRARMRRIAVWIVAVCAWLIACVLAGGMLAVWMTS